MGKGGGQKAHLEQIVKVCEEARAAIDAQLEIIKGALDAGLEQHSLDPGAVRRLLAWRRKNEKDPAKRAFDDELDDQYRFLIEGGTAYDMPAKADTEIERVMALCSGDKPPKIEAIKRALECSQGKAHKLRSLAVARLTAKSSSSRDEREHEQLLKRFETPKPPTATYTADRAPHDPETGEIMPESAPVAAGDSNAQPGANPTVRENRTVESGGAEPAKPTEEITLERTSASVSPVARTPEEITPPQDPLAAMEAAAERFEALKARAV